MNELALFAGAGGGILGGHLLGWRTVCAVEWEPYPASVLCARQNDGFLPPFPVWDDVQTFDGRPWRGIVDVVSGGFPCQDISAAGKGAGIDGERSGMWREMARIIHEVRPKFVFVENSPMLTSRGLGRVLGDLAEMGFDAKWGVLGAADVGAPHQRDRIWIVGKTTNTSSIGLHNQENQCVLESQGWNQFQSCKSRDSGEMANTTCIGLETERAKQQTTGIAGSSQKTNVADTRCELWSTRNATNLDSKAEIGSASAIHNQSSSQGQNVSNSDSTQRQGMCKSERVQQEYAYACDSRWWQTEPNVGRMADGVAAGVDRLKAIGNGQVPEVARRAWEVLSEL